MAQMGASTLIKRAKIDKHEWYYERHFSEIQLITSQIDLTRLAVPGMALLLGRNRADESQLKRHFCLLLVYTKKRPKISHCPEMVQLAQA